MNPKTFNKFFAECEKRFSASIKIPHRFASGEKYDDELMRENFDAILMGIEMQNSLIETLEKRED